MAAAEPFPQEGLPPAALRGDCIVLPGNCGLAMPAFVHHLRVRYNECDAQGHVFNANYLVYFDVILAELWREALGSYETLTAEGLDLVVAEAGLRFRAPARFDDELEITLRGRAPRQHLDGVRDRDRTG